jgi:hypothetical protein
MGICINCEGSLFSCGYSHWNTIREEIANAAIAYLREEHAKMEDANETDSYNYQQLSRILDYVDEYNCGTISDFMYLFENADFLNTFIYYHLGGVFALLNKSDDNGYYTAGNSLDICETIDIVFDHIQYEDIKAGIPAVKSVFEKSVNERKCVVVY